MSELEENVDWQLYDAQEGATVYSDMLHEKDGFLSTCHFKDTKKQKDMEPQQIKNDSQLEFHRVVTYIKSVQRQIDTLQ